MIPDVPKLEDYGLAETGFLPAERPLSRIESPYYSAWENIMDQFHQLLITQQLRDAVLNLPILSPKYLKTVAEKRRAYVILSFLAHGYIWNTNPTDRLPASLAIPWDAISLELEIPPVLTLSAVSIWNCGYVDEKSYQDAFNLSKVQTFTGTSSESSFYLISACIESRSAIILPLLLSSLHGVRNRNRSQILDTLQRLAIEIAEIRHLLHALHLRCDPLIFYHSIRPYLRGWNNQSAVGLPNGVIYEGTSRDSEAGYRTYAGGSNAQSALIQALDIVMGISHGTGGKSQNAGFLEEMRQYMPGPHRRFLKDLSRASNLRDFVVEYPGKEGDELRGVYESCVLGLIRFRDLHMQIIRRYILLPSGHAKRNTGGEIGTGGTQLISFLKQVRAETLQGILLKDIRRPQRKDWEE